MLKVIDLFAGIGGLKDTFHDTYANLVEETTLNRIMIECFEETPSYTLRRKCRANQQEYSYARHLADLDILEQFCTIYVRNHRNYKYSRGRADTADRIVQVLSEKGIYISVEKYNNWKRNKGYRLIDNDSLDLLLELLMVTPSEFKRLIYAHISVRREIRNTDGESGIVFFPLQSILIKDSLFAKIKLVRPPCRRVS